MKLKNKFYQRMITLIVILFLVSCKEVPDGIKSKVWFFPDGKKILFAAVTNGISNIYTHELKNKKLKKLTKNKDPEYKYYFPSLSHDGSKIAYSAMKTKSKNGSHVYIMDSDGSNIEKLTNEGKWDGWPVFSATGGIMFFSRLLNYNPERAFGATRSDVDLYSITTDGTNLQKITHRSFFSLSSISVSPDGKSLLFTADLGFKTSGLEKYTKYSPSLIFLIDRFTPEPLTPLVRVEGKRDSTHDASFSSDGKKIVFTKFTKYARGFIHNIFIIDRNGNNIQQITDNDSFNEFPTFSTDMKTVLFLSDKDRTRNYKLMQVDVDGENLHEIKIFEE